MKFNFFKNFRYFLEYVIVIAGYWLIKCLPHAAVKGIAHGAGKGMYLIPPFRKLTEANIRTAFPDFSSKRIKEIAVKSLINLILNFIEFVWMAGNCKRIEKLTSFSDEIRRLIESHGARKESIILVTPHFGDWEAAGIMMTYNTSLRFVVIAKTIRNPYLDRFVTRQRELAGNEIIFSKGAVRNVLKAMHLGKSMATLIDQNTRVRDGGIFVNFFGLPVPSSKAPAIFGKTVATSAIYFGGAIRINNMITAVIEPLPKPKNEYTEDKDIIQDLMHITEKYIRQYPEQYLWFYKRFQYIPADVSESCRKRYPYYASVAPDSFYRKTAAGKRSEG